MKNRQPKIDKNTKATEESQSPETAKREEELKRDVGGAIDKSVFDGETVETVTPSVKESIDGDILSYDRMSKTRTKAKLLKTTASLMEMETAERYYPTIEQGLTAEQVNKRTEQGYLNLNAHKTGKTYTSIFLRNIFTFFNMLTFAVAIALIVFRSGPEKLFFMIIVTLNIMIGIIQEIKSKRTVDKLKLVTAPTAMVVRDGQKKSIPVTEVVLDDIMYLEAGKQICSDSIVVKGEVEVNESLLTGESVPVKKTSGSKLFSGSFVVGGTCYSRVDKVGAANYVEKLTSHAKKYKKPKSEINDAVTAIIKFVSVLIIPIAAIMLFMGRSQLSDWADWQKRVQLVGGAVIGMIPAGMFLLTSVALATSVIRLAKRRTLVQDLYCIEMLARANVLCLDKTGTITDGTMQVHEIIEIKNSDSTLPLGDVIGSMLTATEDNNQTALALADKFGYSQKLKPIKIVPFSSSRKLSAVTFENAGTFILGAPEFVVKEVGIRTEKMIDENAANGFRVLMLAHSPMEIKDDKLPAARRPVCLIVMEDHIRDDAAGVIKWFKENDVAVKVISGDNPLTVSEVAKRVGIKNAELYISLDGLSTQEVIEAANKYTVFGRVTPEQKSILVKSMKAKGNTVAMTGDGVNDILAMREADCSVAMASGSEAARNASHLVLLDSNFSSMPQVVMEGRRVVNNIQKSSALFLMKTFMSVLLSIIFPALMLAGVSTNIYPFDTSNLIPLEFFVIAIPSFALAMQPNNNIIKGRFLGNVIKRCIPGGIALVFAVMSVYFYDISSAGAASNQFYTTMLVDAVVFTGLISLIKICQPFDAYRIFVVIASFVLCILSLTVLIDAVAGIGISAQFRPFGDVVNFMSIGFNNITFLSTVVLFSYFIISVTMSLLNKIKIGESINDNQ